ncbi:MAG: hypothetical protein M3R36_16170 [Bacteroidota bacterium]|nr:hypothetical protein [Bacteroidota bacterium]
MKQENPVTGFLLEISLKYLILFFNGYIFAHLMNKRKINLKVLFLMLLGSGFLYAAVSLQYFVARDNANGVLVEWKTNDEGGTVKFEIERSSDTPDNFSYLDLKNATGNNSYYSYQDNTVDFRNGRTSSIYYYRLKCVEGNGNYTYTNHITVSHTVSGIRSTWGSIKAIFR